MLTNETKDLMEKGINLKKKAHKAIMSDSLQSMDYYTYNVVRETLKFIDSTLNLFEEQNKTLDKINDILINLLDKIED